METLQNKESQVMDKTTDVNVLEGRKIGEIAGILKVLNIDHRVHISHPDYTQMTRISAIPLRR
jgi:hypothetical protein